MYGLGYYLTHHQRSYHFFYNPDFLAAYFVFSLPLSLSLLYDRYLTYKNSQRLTKKDILLYFLTIVQIAGFITTFSRAASLGFSASILFLILLKASKKIWRCLALYSLILLSAGSIIIMAKPQLFIGLLGIRTAIWEGTISLITANPVFGSGIGSFSRLYPSFRPAYYFLFPEAAPMTLHSHNEFLETWAETGIIGLILILVFITTTLISSVKSRGQLKNKVSGILITGISSGAVGLLFQNIFCVSLRLPFMAFYLWLGLGLCAGLSHSRRYLHLKITPKPIKLIIIIFFLSVLTTGLIKFTLYPFLADFYLQKSFRERTNGHLDKAIDNYNQAITFSPKRPDLYYYRAFLLNKLGKKKEALRDYLKVEALSPGYSQVYLNLGITYLSLGEITKAETALRMAISSNPYDSQAHNSLGVAYAKINLREKARNEFERALNLNPNLETAKLNLIKLGYDYIT